jgi:hypothetical protein
MMKLDIVIIQRAPFSAPGTELDVIAVQSVVIESATEET